MAFVGEIRMMAFTPPPPGWVPCDGQELRIADHPLLSWQLGDAFGGDGHTVFAMPDLRGRVPIHVPSSLRGSSPTAVIRRPDDEPPRAPDEAGSTPVSPYLTLSFCLAVTSNVSAPWALDATQPLHAGEIRLFAGDFDPVGWMSCEGQALSPTDHPALFAAIGTTYGGDGETWFALPDLRGRVPVHQGDGFALGQGGGQEGAHDLVAMQPPHCLRFLIALGTTPPEEELLVDDDTPVIGEVRLFGVERLPEGWVPCDGLTMSLTSHTALFSVVGYRYGYHSRETFSLPDLKYAAPRHPGPVTVSTRAGEAPGSATIEPNAEQLPGTLGLVLGIATNGLYPMRTR